MTNWEKVTASPETLAKLIKCISNCHHLRAYGICQKDKCGGYISECEQAALEWLQEEASN